MRGPRVGFIAPASFETTLVELYRMMPEHVSVVATTLRVNRIARDELEAEAKRMEEGAAALGRLDVDLIAISGAPVA